MSDLNVNSKNLNNSSRKNEVSHARHLANRKPTHEIPDAYNQVAEGMETQFIYNLFQEMRKTIDQEKPDSNAVNFYKSMQDYEASKVMAQKEDSLGVKNIILEQIYPHYAEYKKSQELAKRAMANESAYANPVRKGLKELDPNLGVKK